MTTVWRVALALAALGASWFAFGGTWRALTAPRPETEFAIDEDFPSGRVAAGARVAASGFVSCPDGWCLPQATSGTLDYTPPARSTGVLSRIAPWFYVPERGSNEIAMSIDGGRTFVPLAGGRAHGGIGFSIPVELQKFGVPIVLRFSMNNGGRNEALALDKLIVVYTREPSPDLTPRATFMWAFFVAGLAVVAFGRRPVFAVAALATLTLDAGLRYAALGHAVDRPLDPDARVYRYLASSMDLFSPDHGFYSANFNEREPGFVLAVHGFFLATHDSEYHLRLLTVSLSVVLVLVAMALAWTMCGPIAAIVTGLLLALNAPLIGESVRGLRLEGETIVWLLLLGFLFVWYRPVDNPGFTAAGAFAGALLLVRSSYGPSLVVLLGLAAWTASTRWRVRLQSAAIAFTVMAGLVVPHRVAMYHRRGDAFWDTATYARWLANFEFAGRPGFPTLASLQRDGYQGAAITYGHYLFGLHTPQALAVGTARGYYKMLLNMRAPVAGTFPGDSLAGRRLSTGVWLVCLAGMIAALFDRRYRWMPVAFVTVLAPAAFLYDRGLLELYRHSYQAFPLLLLAAWVPLALVRERWAIRGGAGVPPAEAG